MSKPMHPDVKKAKQLAAEFIKLWKSIPPNTPLSIGVIIKLAELKDVIEEV